MKRIVLICSFLTVLTFVGQGQGSIELTDRPFAIQVPTDTAITNFLRSQTAYAQLDKVEQDAVYWINVMRQDPSSFYDLAVAPFLAHFPEAKSSYVNSLRTDLKKSPPLSRLKVTALLVNTATAHASDLGRNKSALSHNSTNGTSFQDRMVAAGVKICAYENIYTGKKDALLSLILLLIDAGVPGTGHRKTLLNPELNSIGVAFQPYGSTGFILVQDFSCE